MKCHDKVDRNEINIKGWIETSNGRQLDYEIVINPSKQTKYTPEVIEYIKSLKTNNDVVDARNKIKDKFNIKVSSQSILKYW